MNQETMSGEAGRGLGAAHGSASPPTLGKVVRAIVAMLWIMPLALLIGLCNIKRAEKIGFIYRDAVKGFAEL